MSIAYPLDSPQSVLTGDVQPSLQERIFNEMRQEIYLLRAENSQQRERIATQDEEIDALREGRLDYDLLEEKDTLIAGLRGELATLTSQYADLDHRHTDTTMRFAEFREWIITLFHNTTIPVACKIVLLFFHILFQGETGREKHITMKELAKVTGYDEGTDRKACDKLAMWDIIDRRYEDLILEDGTKYSKGIVHFTLSPIVATPEYIKMENRHGGERERKCSNPDCRSTALDNYTVRHCRDCKESAWYGQPGLANDADLKAAQIGHIVAQNRRSGNNQDAFSPSGHPNQINTAITVVDSQLVEVQTTNAVGQSAVQTEELIINLEEERKYPRYNAAEQLLSQLSSYGYALAYLPDGKRKLTHTANAAKISKGETASIIKRIDQYNPELLQIWQDSQTPSDLPQPVYDGQIAIQKCTSGNNQDAFDLQPASQDESVPQSASSSDLQTLCNEQGQGAQLDAQRIPLPSTASCKGLGVLCEICRYNEAIRIWKTGKHYCQACVEREAVS